MKGKRNFNIYSVQVKKLNNNWHEREIGTSHKPANKSQEQILIYSKI
jgi:hypothetical protein